MYQGIKVRQQYGILTERVLQGLNSINGSIYLKRFSPDELSLLFRDMGFGDGLVTKDIAKKFEQGLEEMVYRSNEAHRARLRRLLNTHTPKYSF